MPDPTSSSSRTDLLHILRELPEPRVERNGLVLGQRKVDEKSNEPSAAR